VPARLVVVGLGPGDPSAVTVATRDALAAARVRFVRTRRHPSAHLAEPAISFDDEYEHAASLEDVYEAIVRRVIDEVARTADGETVVYAVPGSPLVGERTVELLRAHRGVSEDGIEIDIVPALSFIDLAWAALGVDPLATGARLVDGHRFAIEAAGDRGPLLVGQCDSRFVLSEIKLAVEEPPDRVVVVQRLGLEDERVIDVAWDDLDRVVEPDHLTSLWIPELHAPVGGELVRFYELVRTLRERCPWDREQTHQSLTRHLLEETYEVLEAIDSLEPSNIVEGPRSDEPMAHLEEELGDLLFQVYFHAVIAEQDGQFNLADVARGIHNKLYARHPHVFGDVRHDTAADVLQGWEQRKLDEKGRTSMLDGIPAALPALLYADKAQRRAAAAGFDWPDVEGAWTKIIEETQELRAELDARPHDADALGAELGDLLFSLVNVARHLEIDAETALRGANDRFRTRFQAIERLAAERGLELRGLTLDELDALWDEAKALPRA